VGDSTVHVITVFGIPIGVNAGFVLIYAVLAWSLAVGYFPARLPGLDPLAYWASGLLAALLLFVSVLLHELAHSLIARRNGVAVRGITLHVLGGVSQLAGEPPSPAVEASIAVAGPLASFAIAAALWGVQTTGAQGPTWAGAIVGYLVLVNVAIGLFNLIPGFPLDGGRLVRAVAWWWTGDVARATAIASRGGRIVALALIGLGIVQAVAGALVNGLWLAFIGVFLHRAASMSLSAADRTGLAPTVADVMTRDVVTVPATATLADVVERFWRRHVTSFPVLDGPMVVGVVSVHDVGAVPASRWDDTGVAQAMRPLDERLTIGPTASVADALHKAVGNGLGRLVVVDGSRLVGYLSITDLMPVATGMPLTPTRRAA